MKRLFTLTLVLVCLMGKQAISQQTFPLRGKVIDAVSGEELPGALVKVSDSQRATVADASGEFSIRLEEGEYEIILSFIGYTPQKYLVKLPQSEPLKVTLKPEGLSMAAVEIVSTGYQELPRERATGSFVFLDKETVSRRITPNFLDRLEDVTPGLTFNRGGTDPISIRGRSTIFANNRPLVVIDNFPYDGPLENINPNDIESISVLRDAAAASIWGAQAGNGVIVITTKSGSFSSPVRVDITSNYSITDRPDAFYPQLMGPETYIDIEKQLFGRGFYTGTENSIARAPLSPVVETLIDLREGRINQGQADARISGLAAHDVRHDFNAYMYRPRIHNQQAITVSGGGQNSRYSISGGYDKLVSELLGNDNGRYTFSVKNDSRLLKEKLNITSGLYVVKSSSNNNSINPATLTMQASGAERLYPYARLRDENGNKLPITYEYRRDFILESERNGLLDWQFSPLQDIDARNNSIEALDLRMNLGAEYSLHKNLVVSANYQYWQNESTGSNLNSTETYFTRNLINRLTQVTEQGLVYPVPVGAILDRSQGRSFSQQLRGLVRYNNKWKGKHDLSLIGGAELRDLSSSSFSNRFFGFDTETGSTSVVDLVNFFNLYHMPNSVTRIPNLQGISGNVERFTSVFANAGYTYADRYLLSLSARKDASNIFGVDTNLRGVPLWSFGAGWILSEEGFYGLDWLPFLKLRFTQGYNGNVDRTLSAQTTAQIFGDSFLTGRPFARIQNPPNPLLRWERISISNFALDFESRNGRLSGTFEYYIKNGIDLIGEAPFAPSSGVSQFRGNIASTNTKGMDINIQSFNLTGMFKWSTNYILSTVNEKITDYEIMASPGQYLTFGAMGAVPLPFEGRPLYSVYAMPWAGLNPDNGNPRGFLDGEPSENYAAIFANTTADDLLYMGPARPTLFGAVRNSFEYKNISLSFTLAYRAGYYYRRESIIYGSNFGLGGHSDYDLRWKQPGDENLTQVPSVPQTGNFNRDDLYRFADILVERGDHIRLRDIRLAYRLNNSDSGRLPFRNAEVFFYADNLGVIWKKSSDPLDPDFRNLNQLKNFSMGLNVSF
ncbi:SusC/RagA family TonB-linked outer membrane protein [Arthrospiribacter ruber]|uniref:SusC/RagA family TonB-linked outer membrane protein n=1 Tax=Arthrospiribacter ruber TaxID=2487934 RepID=A0A951IR94_9BACT|nr:SusC/RagA family TonB-linked outer membrane protein [Arthrospiribacter ruber]MBW3466610.1 SusC/RagA family TonB-linked outer membrane protein [Arthrospiribacter ruber]